jgi:serine/threonine protein phosphatase PrpC
MLNSFGSTHIGQRKVNEDYFLVDENIGLYIVTDGVGGLSKGEIASQLTCKTIYDEVKNGVSLAKAVVAAHKRILIEVSTKEDKKGMASTVVAVLFRGNAYEIAWVGDSRAYLWDGNLKLLTRDHSYVELLLETGHITYDQLRTHPEKNVISQALGIARKEISVAQNKGTLENGQILFLATDGLYEITNEKEIINQINTIKSIEELTHNLVNYAVKEQGKDNITLLTIKSEIDTSDISKKIEAKVVRSFDNETGEVKKEFLHKKKEVDSDLDNEEEPEIKKEPKVKSVAPRVINSVESDKPVTAKKSRTIEILLLVLIFLSILILIVLKLNN